MAFKMLCCLQIRATGVQTSRPYLALAQQMAIAVDHMVFQAHPQSGTIYHTQKIAMRAHPARNSILLNVKTLSHFHIGIIQIQYETDVIFSVALAIW